MTVNLRLTGISGGAYGLSSAVLKIVDNDGPPGTVNFAPATYTTSQSAPAVALTVMRTGAARWTLTIQCATTNGTAISGLNYIGSTNTLVWNDLEYTPKTVVVPLVNNGQVGPNTTFGARLFHS